MGNSLDTITDCAGRVFEYTVSNGLLMSIDLPDPGYEQESVSFSFTHGGPRDQLQTVRDGEPNETVLAYDATLQGVSRVTNADTHDWELVPYVADGLSESTGSIYASSSRAIGDSNDGTEAFAIYTDARDHVWTHQLDRFGMMTAKSAPGTASTNDAKNVWKWERDQHGLPTRFTEPAGAGTVTSGRKRWFGARTPW